MICPMCGNEENVIKYGRVKQTGYRTDKAMRQRYRCKECNITFYDENDYIKSKGKSDIRVNLLGIVLKHSDFNLSDLNKFFGLTENSSEISLWERNLIKADLSKLRMPYMKSCSHAYIADDINSKQNVINNIEHCVLKKGIFIALDDNCTISYIDIFDENIK